MKKKWTNPGKLSDGSVKYAGFKGNVLMDISPERIKEFWDDIRNEPPFPEYYIKL